METFLTLSPVEHQILASYQAMLDGLGNFLGSHHEIVLHSLESLDHSVLKIINGHFSSRKEGAPITDLALNMLTELKKDPKHEAFPYYTRTHSGELLKACTIPITGEKNRIIGLICINFHMELPLTEYLKELIPPNPDNSDSLQSVTIAENFSDNIDDLILSALAETRSMIYNDASITSANQNKEIVAELYDKGIFNLKDAVIKVAEQLGISKNTVYMHIRNLKNR